MKSNILSIEGKKIKEIELPKCFSQEIREDIVSRVLEAKKTKQPYGPSPVAGNQYSASGKIQHRRHVWKTHYGKGISRIPRKIMSRRGSQFIWVGATIPGATGGRRAHPPKVISMLDKKKINKKEMEIALVSALSATANKKEVRKKYERLNDEKIDLKNLPFIVESKIVSLKAKELLESFKKIFNEELFDILLKKRKIRSGKGKLRGRKYKSNAGILMVMGKSEKIKTNLFETASAANLNITDLAKGGQGRLVLYTEQAIKNLGERFK
jgi:large subunit ribosomal protein L4e|tara:strand:+ start:1434 stop:2237 length:804 start_codon:yes stop_codon:yes gene_type:complete